MQLGATVMGILPWWFASEYVKTINSYLKLGFVNHLLLYLIVSHKSLSLNKWVENHNWRRREGILGRLGCGLVWRQNKDNGAVASPLPPSHNLNWYLIHTRIGLCCSKCVFQIQWLVMVGYSERVSKEYSLNISHHKGRVQNKTLIGWNKFYTWSHLEIYSFFAFIMASIIAIFPQDLGRLGYFQSCPNSCRYEIGTPDQV